MGPLFLHAFELLARPRDSFGALLLCNNYKIAAFQKQKGNLTICRKPMQDNDFLGGKFIPSCKKKKF
jgi:hypothetical protein